MRMERWLSKRNTILLVLVLALWRLYLSATLQLHPDEAYYWLWSRHPDLSYYDHPPLVAGFIGLTTLGAQSELWVRLSGTLVVLLLSVLIWRLALQFWRSVPVAAGSVIAFNAYPLSGLGLMAITPDVPLFLFWFLAVYLYAQIMRTGRAGLWYALGLAFGLALLSKYTAVLLVPCLLLHLALSAEGRRWLRTVHPYLALLLALLCFAPVLYWNATHGWVSFEFQLNHGLGGRGLALAGLAEYLGGQLLLVGPVAWLLGLHAALRGLYQRERHVRLLIATTLPVVVFFGLTSLRSVAGPNWPAYAYAGWSLLLGHYGLAGSSRLRRAGWLAAVLSSLALSLLAMLHARYHVLPLERWAPGLGTADATNALHGWRELGAALAQAPQGALVLTPSHQLSAEIAYYSQGHLAVQTDATARPSQFNYWPGPAGATDRTAMYVWIEGEASGPPAGYYATPTAHRTLAVWRDGVLVRRYHLVTGRRLLPPFRPPAPAEPG